MLLLFFSDAKNIHTGKRTSIGHPQDMFPSMAVGRPLGRPTGITFLRNPEAPESNESTAYTTPRNHSETMYPEILHH
jgi:hypothetical protein